MDTSLFLTPDNSIIPNGLSTLKVISRKTAQGRMHKKRDLDYHKSTQPHLRTHSNSKREMIRDRATGVWIITKDNISKDDNARRNCAVLASEERASIKPNLYTQEELKESQASVWMREQGINPQLFNKEEW